MKTLKRMISFLLTMVIFVTLPTSCVSTKGNKGDASLTDFGADETRFLAGEEASITFTVTATGINEPITLCDGNEKTIGMMHDDGLDGDAIANDGIYTYVVTTVMDDTSNIDYCAKSGSLISNSITVYFFAYPTEESMAIVSDSQAEMEDIGSKYEDENGYVAYENVSTVIAEVATYVETLYQEGTVIFYEVNDENVVVQYSNGITVVYLPKIEGMSSAGPGSDISMRIITCQPSRRSDGVAHKIIPFRQIDDAASLVVEEFDNYSFNENFDDEAVTLDRVKLFASNQVILWQGHGGYSKDFGPFLGTGDERSVQSDKELYSDNIKKRIIVSGSNLCFTSKFVDKYCGRLDNSLIYLGTCHSGNDARLANAFINKGAAAVVGNNGSINMIYNSCMMYDLMKYMTEIDLGTSNYHVLFSALEKAKEENFNWGSLCGNTETTLIFGNNGYRLGEVETGPEGSLEIKVYKGPDRTQGSAMLEIYEKDSGLLYKRTPTFGNGVLVINLPIGEYHLVITDDGYEPSTHDVNITEGCDIYYEALLLAEETEEPVSTEPQPASLTDAEVAALIEQRIGKFDWYEFGANPLLVDPNAHTDCYRIFGYGSGHGVVSIEPVTLENNQKVYLAIAIHEYPAHDLQSVNFFYGSVLSVNDYKVYPVNNRGTLMNITAYLFKEDSGKLIEIEQMRLVNAIDSMMGDTLVSVYEYQDRKWLAISNRRTLVTEDIDVFINMRINDSGFTDKYNIIRCSEFGHSEIHQADFNNWSPEYDYYPVKVRGQYDFDMADDDSYEESEIAYQKALAEFLSEQPLSIKRRDYDNDRYSLGLFELPGAEIQTICKIVYPGNYFDEIADNPSTYNREEITNQARFGY